MPRNRCQWMSFLKIPTVHMSFLPTEDDTFVLDEALAFIDSYGEHADTTDSSSDPDFHLLDDGVETNRLQRPNTTSTEETRKLEQQKKKNATKKRRVRSAETSSTALQRRKRAELATLREQAEELQDVLAKLKRAEASPSLLNAKSVTNGETDVASGSTSQHENSGQSRWYGLAIEQYRKRLQAEKTNRHLKAIMANQEKVRKSICGVLHKRSVVYGMDFVMRNESPRSGGALSIVHNVDVLMGELEDTVEDIHRRTNSVFRPKQQPASINCTTQAKFDERRKTKVVEFETTTPMQCTLEHAKNLVWKDFSASRELGRKPNSLQKMILVTMQSRTGAIHAEKLHVARKFEDEDQMLISWADIMVLPTKQELRYRTEGWILVTRSETDPSHACVVRSLLKLYLDPANVYGRVRAEDLAYANDVVLGAMAMKLRKFWQSLQDMLLERAFKH